MRAAIIALVALLVILAATAGVAVAVDSRNKDVLAEGITIGGVPVGGKTVSQAKTTLERELVARLEQPIRIDHGKRRWELGAREAKVHADIRASVDHALAASRQGSLIDRTWRLVSGGQVDKHLDPDITYSDAAIVRTIDKVRKEVNRPARDARAELGLSGPRVIKGATGLEVDASGLHRKMRAAIVSATAPRTFSAKTEKVKPKVSDEQARKSYDTALVVNRTSFRLTLYKHYKAVKTYTVAVGAAGLETPAGTYHIQNKAVNPAWTKPHSSWVAEDERGEIVPGGTAQNPLKARWMGIFDGAGIHGVDPSEYGSLGSAASHGCVRMRIPDVIELYDQVPVHTPIYIG